MWSNAPDFDAVQDTFRNLASVKAQIRLLQAEIDIRGNETKKNNPRKSYLLIEQFPDEYQKIAELEAEKERLEGQARFFDYHKDMYKSYGYVNR
jgi:hypothetical protein